MKIKKQLNEYLKKVPQPNVAPTVFLMGANKSGTISAAVQINGDDVAAGGCHNMPRISHEVFSEGAQVLAQSGYTCVGLGFRTLSMHTEYSTRKWWDSVAYGISQYMGKNTLIFRITPKKLTVFLCNKRDPREIQLLPIQEIN